MGQILGIKPADKAVTKYFNDIKDLHSQNQTKESAVEPVFIELLNNCAKKVGWLLSSEFVIKRIGKRPDAAFLDIYSYPKGYLEAKDDDDDLENEVRAKFAIGYPRDNTLFWQPKRIIIYQNGKKVFDEPIAQVKNKKACFEEISSIHKITLVNALNKFFEFEPPHYEQWLEAVDKFKETIPDHAFGLLKKIEEAKQKNQTFIGAFNDFRTICQQSINPNISDQAIEEMIIQHILTERLLRKVFDMDKFSTDNTIARQLEVVINALTSENFSRKEFLGGLDGFYKAIETAAEDIEDFSQKQSFINTIYEKFFQGYAIKSADTLGIVYTPQAVVEFMVRSVEELLKSEFGKSLSSKDVHIIDPFVGTGNFILRVMREIDPTDLDHKYKEELHCNEIALMPYYIASMNIEHEYLNIRKKYQPFNGICFADTFEMYELIHKKEQGTLLGDWFGKENTARVKRQLSKPIKVIITNPPYNAHQANENDKSKNRKYPSLDDEIRNTYSKDSKATLRNALSDPYVKAIKWASKRIEEEGIIAIITNNSFIDNFAFDGMRKHLEQDFDKIFILDLGGNVRKNPKLSGTTNNVFGIQVGVSIMFLIKNRLRENGKIYFARLDEYWRKDQKYDLLNEKQTYKNIDFQDLTPDPKHNWLTEGMSNDFDSFIAIGDKEEKGNEDCKAIFRSYSLGVNTSRDEWAYNFDKDELSKNMNLLINTYNSELERWKNSQIKTNIEEFINNDTRMIKWSDRLIIALTNEEVVEYDSNKIRKSIYRPFISQYLYFDHLLNQRRYQQHKIFPTAETEKDNLIICMSGIGHDVFRSFISNKIVEYKFSNSSNGGTQCFPLYTYSPDGSNRKDNITDYSLSLFRDHYKSSDSKNTPPPNLPLRNQSGGNDITKLDIFYYVYGLLHHPGYREEYKENLRRNLPHIPFAPDFWSFSNIGRKLADLHINYEQAKPYPLEKQTDRELFSDVQYKVKKMRFSKDKTQLIYNEAITFVNIPKEAHEYRLGNRSALDWIVDQYQVTTDSRSGIVQDPNNFDGDEKYIFDLIGKVVTVSLETVALVRELSGLAYK